MAISTNNPTVVNIKSETTIRAIYGDNPELNAAITVGDPTETGTIVALDYTGYISDPLAGNFSTDDDSQLFINWGDGTTNYNQRFTDGPFEVTHTYTTPGTYTISAAMRDPKGNLSETEEFTITTAAPPAPPEEISYCGDSEATNYQDPDALEASNPDAVLIRDDTLCEYEQAPTWVSCVDGVQDGEVPDGYRYVSDGDGGFCWDPIGSVTIDHRKVGTDEWKAFRTNKILFNFQRGTSGTSANVEVRVRNRFSTRISRRITARTNDLFRIDKDSFSGTSDNQYSVTVPPNSSETFLIGIVPDTRSNFGDGITEFNIEIEVEDL
jgi:PKD repeat protein